MLFIFLGCKIKALRAKTNTYIKTPVRGEEPIFAISGRPEHVASARREILDFVEHLSELRAARSGLEETVTINVWVPYHVVGLVVGPKGATVKRIQQVTQTYIITPSRDKEPFFEVKGTATNVERARKEIESYIALRTNLEGCDDFVIRDIHSTNNGGIEENVFSHFHKNLAPQKSDSFSGQQITKSSVFQFPALKSALADLRHREYSMDLCPTTRSSPMFQLSDNAEISTMLLENNGVDAVNSLGAISREACKCGYKPTANTGTRFSPSNISYQPKSAPFRIQGNGLIPAKSAQPISPTGSYESNSSDGISTISPKLSPELIMQQFSVNKSLAICSTCMAEGEEMTALIPCRHSFCQKCACYISTILSTCPLCSAQVTNVMHL